jgi:uncharacterized delta-60 repeat protein
MKKIYLFFFLIILNTFSIAQNPASLDLNFGGFPGFSLSGVNVIQKQSDDKILAGGDFTSYQGYFEKYLVRLNTDGSLDESFSSNILFNQRIESIQIQPDGKILVGGAFTSFNGVTQNYLIRLNTNGTEDTSFEINNGFNDVVNSIQLQNDGKILVGGTFTSYQGVVENRLIRLNTDGTKDLTFNTNIGFNNNVKTIYINDFNKIFVGGDFTQYNSESFTRIVKLNNNGTVDYSFNTGSGFNNTVFTIEEQADNKVLIGGSFNSYQGLNQYSLIRLNDNGSKDSSFNTGYGVVGITTVRKIKILNNSIFVGGNFQFYDLLPQNRLIKLNLDGTKDNSFNINLGFDNSVKDIIFDINDDIFVAGNFTSFNQISKVGLVKLNDNGSTDDFFNTGKGFNSSVETIEQQPDGKILVGGAFTTFNRVLENKIIRFNPIDGSKDATFNIGTGFNYSIFTIKAQPDGKILVGGAFTSYQGQNYNQIIRLNANGDIDFSFIVGAGFNNFVSIITIQPDGKILVGGLFTTYNGQNCNRIIRLNTDGSIDTNFNIGTGFNSSINDIKLQSDGKILVGGTFTSYNGQTKNKIIRLNDDGTIDSGFIINNGFFLPGENVSSIKIQSDGKIVVGGNFTYYQLTAQNHLIRLNNNGSIDTSFAVTGTDFTGGSILSVDLQSDGKILVGGFFLKFEGIDQVRCIRLNGDGTKDTSFDINLGFIGGSVSCIKVQTDGKILAGGNFTNYNNYNSCKLVRLLGGNDLLYSDVFNKESFNFYPNPAQDFIYINPTSNSLVDSVEIYNLQGKLLVSFEKINSINISSLKTGIYIMKMKTNNVVESKRIIKE